jgi:SAM-dependent methyltransferase
MEINMKELKKIHEMTRQSYNIVAEKYHELFKDEMHQKAYDRKFLDDFSRYFTRNAIIYDMGCGPSGHIGHYLHEKGVKVIGVDISEKCVEIASHYQPDMQFFCMDMANLDLEEQSIDGIIAFYSIIHTPKTYVPALFQEFHRVLKKGGKLLVTVKEGDEEGYLDEFLEYKTPIYFTHFIQEEIETYFVENGFSMLFLQNRIPGSPPVKCCSSQLMS